MTLIRPLLDVTRAEIESYCRRYDLRYIEDSSNAETCFTRNKLRHLVIPVLKEINPKFEQACGRLMSPRHDESVADFLRESGVSITRKALDDIADMRRRGVGGRISVPSARGEGRIFVRIKKGVLSIEKTEQL